MDATPDRTVDDDDDPAGHWVDDDDDDFDDDDDIWPDDDGWPWEPIDGDAALAAEALWPRCPMLVLRDEDLVFCAAAMVRGVVAPVPTLWLVVLAGDGWTLSAPIEQAGVPLAPDPARATAALTTFLTTVTLPAQRVDPDISLIAVIYRPDGGACGAPERVWTESLLTAATAAGLPVRAVVAAGDDRVRVLTARAVTR